MTYDHLREALRAGQLWAAPQYGRIFRKKGYYSKDRQADIVTDVSIELFLPHQQHPSLLWIFECKDYAGSVGVDDLEEFHSKLQQIGANNTKGTFVTSGALQRSALAFAFSTGIGIIRAVPKGRWRIAFTDEASHSKHLICLVKPLCLLRSFSHDCCVVLPSGGLYVPSVLSAMRVDPIGGDGWCQLESALTKPSWSDVGEFVAIMDGCVYSSWDGLVAHRIILGAPASR